MSYKSSEKNSNFQRNFKISFGIIKFILKVNEISAIDEKNQVFYAD